LREMSVTTLGQVLLDPPEPGSKEPGLVPALTFGLLLTDIPQLFDSEQPVPPRSPRPAQQ